MSWPVTLPDWPMVSEIIDDKYIRSDTDSGIQIVRKRYLKTRSVIELTLKMNGAQTVILDGLYEQGTFTAGHPRRDKTVTYRFLQAPEYEQVTGDANASERLFDAFIQLEII